MEEKESSSRFAAGVTAREAPSDATLSEREQGGINKGFYLRLYTTNTLYKRTGLEG